MDSTNSTRLNLVTRRIVVVWLMVGGLIVGFMGGVLLTAPVVGWPHAFPGLLMDASEPVREGVSLILMVGCPIVLCVVLWLVILRRLWKK